MFLEAIGLSLVASLLSYELIGLSPGGLIVPGYLALLAGRPGLLLHLAVASLATFLLVKLLSNYVILFGRRRFVLMVLVGFAFMRTIELLFSIAPSLTIEIQGLGYLVPGLLANDMEKQGIVATVLAAVIASGIIRMILLLLGAGVLL